MHGLPINGDKNWQEWRGERVAGCDFASVFGRLRRRVAARRTGLS